MSAVVLIISMFLPWYGVSVKGGIGQFQVHASKNADAWEAYGGRDILLFLIALVVIGYVVLRAMDALPTLGFDAPLGVAVLGAVAVLVVIIGLIHIPTGGAGGAAGRIIGIDFSRKFGIFLGFLATLGITYGGWAAYNERRRGFAPAAAGPGGTLGGPGAIPPAGGAPVAAPGAQPATAPTEPLGTTQPSATPSSPGPAAGGEAGTAPAPTGTPPASDPGAAPAGGPPQPAQQTPPQPPPQQQQSPPADWYPDPHGQARLRWWDGSQWTDQTAN